MKFFPISQFLPANMKLQPVFYVDLGTHTVKVMNKESKFFLSVPNCVIYHTQTGEVISVGHEALMKQGKLPQSQALGWPIQRGVIADVPALQHVLEFIFKRFQEKEKGFGGIFFPKIILAIPEETSEVERRALQKCWEQIGVAQLLMKSNGLAMAVSAGVRPDDVQARVIVDIGFALTQIFVIANGVCIAYRKLESAGQLWTQSLIRHLKHVHQVEISHENAESVKQNLGIRSNYKQDTSEESSRRKTTARMPATVVRGRNMQTFFPTTIKVTQADVTEALTPALSKILHLTQEIFAELPPAVVADIMKYGIFLVGGSALLPGLKEYLTSAMQIQVWVVDHPESATVKGLELLGRS